MKKYSTQAFVEVNESDASDLAIADGEKVRVVSSTGEVTTIAKITDTLSQGMLFMPISFPETPVNELFGISLDPKAKTPSLKTCSVRIEKNSSPLTGEDYKSDLRPLRSLSGEGREGKDE